MSAPSFPNTPRIPLATYRVQLNRGFTFADAARIVPYLRALGISDSYTSPYLKAVPGSSHGYDVVDPTALNPELGTRNDYDAFIATLARHDMGHLFDVVPNHMGIAASANAWWLDVLENGPSSPFAAFFDIDWHPVKLELNEKVLLPILGTNTGRRWSPKKSSSAIPTAPSRSDTTTTPCPSRRNRTSGFSPTALTS